jgi:hypothetical protein
MSYGRRKLSGSEEVVSDSTKLMVWDTVGQEGRLTQGSVLSVYDMNSIPCPFGTGSLQGLMSTVGLWTPGEGRVSLSLLHSLTHSLTHPAFAVSQLSG